MLLVLPVARLGLPSMRGSNERTPADGRRVWRMVVLAAHTPLTRVLCAPSFRMSSVRWLSNILGPPTASVRDRGQALFRVGRYAAPVAFEAINIPVLDVLREIRSSFRATSFTEIAKIVERVECPTFQRLSQSIRSHFRRKVSFGDDIANFFSAFDNGR